MKIEELGFFREAQRFIGYGCAMGWHERNAGNISLRLSQDEIESINHKFDYSAPWNPIPVIAHNMGGEFIFTTVSGSYFIDMNDSPENKFCICEISPDGSEYRVVWGINRPTSELNGHILSLSQLKSRGKNRAVYHCHPANIVALSYILPLNEKDISEAIWESETECSFVLPEGIGVVGFHIPGSIELATATAEKVKDFNVVLWAFHGIFATGEDIKSAFGIAHAVEKAAEIKLKVISSGRKTLNSITKKQQEETASYYGTELKTF